MTTSPAALAAARAIGGVPIVLTHSPDLVRDLPADQALVLPGIRIAGRSSFRVSGRC
jgi:hypothetical protein